MYDICWPLLTEANVKYVLNLCFLTVVECPTEAHLNSLVTNAELTKYDPNVADSEAVSLSLIVHFTPDSVMQTSAYQEWMKR